MITERLELSSTLEPKNRLDWEIGGKEEQTFQSDRIDAEGVGESDVPKLSRREREVVHRIRQAKSNKQIAFELCLTVGTVKEYVYHIFRKVGVANRTELALWGSKYQSEP